jgi:hypothetical protein
MTPNMIFFQNNDGLATLAQKERCCTALNARANNDNRPRRSRTS